MTRKQTRITLTVFVILAIFLIPSGARVRGTARIDYGPSSRTATPSPEPTATPTPSPTAAPTPSPTHGTYEMLRKKDEGTKPIPVARMQARLRELGYFAGEADGIFGTETFNALVAFQLNNGLAGDGIAGQETQTVLYEKADVIDVTGRVFKSGENVSVSARPTPTPTPAPMTLPMDDFTYAAHPLTDYFVSGGYHDDTIRVELSTFVADGASVAAALVTVREPSQLRSALGGTLESPASAPVSVIGAYHRAVIAVAGDNYASLPCGYEARQGHVIPGRNPGKADLLLIDHDGNLRAFTAAGRDKGLEDYEGRVYQAYSGGKTLIVNRIVQPGLDAKTAEPLTAIGQTADGSYLLICAFFGGTRSGVTEAELADLMSEHGCTQAYLLSRGDASGFYYAGAMLGCDSEPRRVSDILYFASAHAEKTD